MTSTAHDIGSVDQFESGKPYAVQVGGKALVIVRKQDQFFAMRDACPHAGARLSAGKVIGLARTEKPGEAVVYCRKGELISCPWHGWEFDLTTGQSLVKPDRVRLRTFPVQAVNGRVQVQL